jgi:hypothetical protein
MAKPVSGHLQAVRVMQGCVDVEQAGLAHPEDSTASQQGMLTALPSLISSNSPAWAAVYMGSSHMQIGPQHACCVHAVLHAAAQHTRPYCSRASCADATGLGLAHCALLRALPVCPPLSCSCDGLGHVRAPAADSYLRHGQERAPVELRRPHLRAYQDLHGGGLQHCHPPYWLAGKC